MDSGNGQPQPTFEVPSQPGKIENAPGVSKEALPSKTELPNPSAPAQDGPAVTIDPATVAQPASDTPMIDDTAVHSSPVISDNSHAEDVDLIEKQWVTKAKKIVEQTKNDPHAQNREISKVKAEYISKRYNKQIKLSEENA